MLKARSSERIEFLNTNTESGIIFFDLSKTGAAILHPTALNEGTRIKLEMNAQVFDATVIYCQDNSGGYRLGLQFQSISLEKQKFLDDIVEGFSRGIPLTGKVIEEIKAKV